MSTAQDRERSEGGGGDVCHVGGLFDEMVHKQQTRQALVCFVCNIS